MEHVLFVCTGNMCRSPLAEALLRARLDARGVAGVVVTSVGTLGSAAGATKEARAVAAEMGGDLAEHRARRLGDGLIESADLVVGMTADHVIDLVYRSPAESARIFKLTELSRRVGEVGARRPGQELRDYVAGLAHGRSFERPWADSRHDPDVTDPYGETMDVYRAIAEEIDSHLVAAIEALWPT